ARGERADDLEPLDRTLLLLALRGADRLAQHRGLGGEVEVLEQLADRLRAHAAVEVDAEPVRRAEAVLELAEDLLVVDDQLRLELAEQPPRLLEPVHGVDGGLARDLARGHAPVVAARRVADELADLLGVLRRDLGNELDEEPAHERARVRERRQRLLLGPSRETAAPEVVVLVEVPLLALCEVVAAA